MTNTHSLAVTLFLLSVEKENKTGETCNIWDEVSESDLSQCLASIGDYDFLNIQRRVVIMHV